MSHDRLAELLDRLVDRRVAVVGDAILDEYLLGRPARVSREAPVLVLEFSRRFCRAGGAANPAVNIEALGARAELVAVAGDDEAGAELLAELARAGLSSEFITRSPGARTHAKSRLLAETSTGHQHVARLDYQPPAPDGETRARLIAGLAAATARAEALLISDYRGGVVDDPLIEQARALGRRHAIPVTVDSQGDLLRFSGLDLVKCNLGEAEATVRRPLRREAEVEAAGQELLELLAARRVVLTRGADGLSGFEAGRPPFHLPAANRTEVFDVTGAGDTVIAVLTLGLIAGGTLAEAAQLANLAAGLVVRRLGVATATPDELRRALEGG